MVACRTGPFFQRQLLVRRNWLQVAPGWQTIWSFGSLVPSAAISSWGFAIDGWKFISRSKAKQWVCFAVTVSWNMIWQQMWGRFIHLKSLLRQPDHKCWFAVLSLLSYMLEGCSVHAKGHQWRNFNLWASVGNLVNHWDNNNSKKTAEPLIINLQRRLHCIWLLLREG